LTKPIVAVLYAGEHLETIAAVLAARDRLLKAGIAVYPTIDSAARTVSTLISYNEFREKSKGA
jgi:acyl-CoA synthetase (NDP forming)